MRHLATRRDMLEEVVTLVVHEDEGGKIVNFDFGDRFHAEFREFDDLDFADAFLCEDGGGAADAAEVEAAVFFCRRR